MHLAEALLQAGQPDAGLAMLAEALAFIHTSGERWWEAACHRLWGECLLAQQEPKHEAGEVAARFQQALEIARHQHARSLELAAAMSLSRLWQQQGKPQEARQLLAEVYDWFPEGFDTTNLEAARALLRKLNQ